MKIRPHNYMKGYVVTIPKSENNNLPIRSAASLQKRKQNQKFSVLPVMSEDELLFPVSTPKAIFELPKLYHSAVVVALIFVYPQVTASI